MKEVSKNEEIKSVLVDVSQIDSGEVKKWYRAKEAAPYLGISVKTLYNLRSQGKLRGVRSGGNGVILYTREELDAYVLGTGNKKF